jgi:8-oxo-dGTP pyrophosphatase MutT (NUDIX family)
MVQVFIKEICFSIHSSVELGNQQLSFHDTEVLEEFLIQYLNRPQNKQFIDIYTSFSFEYFLKNLKVLKTIPAAGGLTLDSQNRALWIFRKGLWDLPKGKVELNEATDHAAVREVEEECGIHSIENMGLLCVTYHIYEMAHEPVLKPTYWYLMQTSFTGKLVPQTEEGIQKVEWKNKAESLKALEQSFPSIVKVIEIAVERNYLR